MTQINADRDMGMDQATGHAHNGDVSILPKPRSTTVVSGQASDVAIAGRENGHMHARAAMLVSHLHKPDSHKQQQQQVTMRKFTNCENVYHIY
jgi:hypothetical protein